MPYKTIFLFSILYDFSNRKIAITRIDTLNTLRSVIKIPFSIFLKPKPRNRKYKEILYIDVLLNVNIRLVKKLK